MNVNPLQEIKKIYHVWDLPVRLFHWVNFLSVISLLFMGFIMLYKKELGITSLDAKIALKQVHVIIGYVFVVNLPHPFCMGVCRQSLCTLVRIPAVPGGLSRCPALC